MKNRYYLIIPLTGIILCVYSCSEILYSKAPCDITYFHFDNKKNDTNKVIFVQRAVFDTTANELSGVIVDSVTNKPIVGAKIYIDQGSKDYSASSDINGRFSFFKNGFDKNWQMTVIDNIHRCLVIRNINVSGGLEIRIKLHEWLTKNK